MTPSAMPVRIASVCARSRAISDSRAPSSRAVWSSTLATTPISSRPWSRAGRLKSPARYRAAASATARMRRLSRNDAAQVSPTAIASPATRPINASRRTPAIRFSIGRQRQREPRVRDRAVTHRPGDVQRIHGGGVAAPIGHALAGSRGFHDFFATAVILERGDLRARPLPNRRARGRRPR